MNRRLGYRVQKIADGMGGKPKLGVKVIRENRYLKGTIRGGRRKIGNRNNRRERDRAARGSSMGKKEKEEGSSKWNKNEGSYRWRSDLSFDSRLLEKLHLSPAAFRLENKIRHCAKGRPRGLYAGSDIMLNVFSYSFDAPLGGSSPSPHWQS